MCVASKVSLVGRLIQRPPKLLKDKEECVFPGSTVAYLSGQV